MRSPWTALGMLAGIVLGLGGCARPTPDAPPFAGPGRLLLLLEGGARGRELVLLGGGGARRIAAPGVERARWLTPDALLLLLEGPDPEGVTDTGGTRLRVLPLAGGAPRDVGPIARPYDPEPSPDGRLLAVGAEAGALGDADLEIWSLADPTERVAVRHQSLEQPRWREDGRALVASVLMADPESDDALGGSFAGSGFRWPRLHLLRRDLGAPVLVWDGERPHTLAPGGSLPLWWDARGVFARQNRGLVRCEAETERCALVFATRPGRRVVDGRPAGPDAAWLLTVEARDAFDRALPDELLLVALPDGALRSRWKAPRGTAILDLDGLP